MPTLSSVPVLTILLLVLALCGEALTIRFRGARLSGSLPALVLAMALEGPLVAAAIAAIAVAGGRGAWCAASSAAIALLGGALFAALGLRDPFALATGVLVVFMLSNAAGFAATAAQLHLRAVLGFSEAFRTVYRTLLPFELAAGLLTAGVAFCYLRLGLAALALLVVVMVVFHQLARTGVKAYERGQELAKRTDELGTLQVGVLTTVMQTLSMRDPMTARHSGAVARYSREVASMLGLPEREIDLIHTAALLHDIGKFILPDSILFADRKLTDEEWELIKLHPEQGAKLVERIDGYGPVAEIVLHHHERYSGGGYPAGIAGEDIPLGSRIIAAADTYDVMTSRDSYRRPVSSEAALAELRRVAGTQLDPMVVEVFERMIVERRVAFSHTSEADFESELLLERRVPAFV
ncbi:MAG TPA: HD-GYP domain-containing protein [Solirubrobacter sp.]|nr:HD-GYP domain-containing protein [Solirubrobacter sp.]